MPNSPKQFTDYLPKLDFASSFFFNPVSPSEIDSEIMTIQLNKAHGLYSFPTRILRSAKHIISQPLSMLINKSIEYGTYPSKLKLAKVIPIYKSGDKSDPSNYRSISLLSIFNRIFEKMNVFMLGALGIMRANGSYIMRTAFRRVHHAYFWVVFK